MTFRLRLFDFPSSGNAYKVRLLLTQLGIDYERVPVDLMHQGGKAPLFLAINPSGRVPVLQVEEGEYLTESNAILTYLAEGTPFFPESRLARARSLSWMFFEQYSHEPHLATARFVVQHLPLDATLTRALDQKHQQGNLALRIMDDHLASRRFFVGDRYGVADIALYAFTHVAHEGGFRLEMFPNVQRWLALVSTQPGHIAIDA